MSIVVCPGIVLDESEIEEAFLQAGGPGGQNVNKTATAVQLRFDAARSPNLPEAVRRRLAALSGRRMSREGVLVITARRHRTQEQNRADARDRLLDLLRRASERPKLRKATKPGRAALERRRKAKSRASSLKASRRKVEPQD